MTKSNVKVVAKSVKAPLVTNKEATAPAVSIEAATLYTTTKQITSAITTAVKTGIALQIENQRIACSIIRHLHEHKDIRVLRHFLDTMPEGLRKKSMSAFFDKFAPVSFGENADTGEAEITYNAAKPANLVMSLTFPWWKASVESAYVPFDLQRELGKLIAKAENKLKKGVSTEKGDNVSAEQVAQLSTIMLALSNQSEQVTEAQAEVAAA